MAKNSFIVYYDWREKFEDLSDKQWGMLIKAILDYEIDSTMPEFTDSGLKIAFKIAKVSLDENRGKYQEICEKRKQSGAKGGKQKVANATQNKQMLANASKCEQNLANLADTDTETDTDIISSPVGLDIIGNRRSDSRSEEVKFYVDWLHERTNEVIDELSGDFTDLSCLHKFKNIVDKVSYQALAITDPIIYPVAYLKALMGYFECDASRTHERISECFMIAERGTVKNRFAYTVSVLYNKIQGV